MLIVSKYFIYFMIYSFIGWILEVVVAYRKPKKFVNRGFLVGPYCPIYGCGALLILILLGNNHSDPLGTFLKSIVIAGILEYFTSYFMEKLYKFRWWDYSNKKFNINGRICLETLIPFGLLAFIIFNYIHPFFISLIEKVPDIIVIAIAVLLFVLFFIDNIISNKMLYKISSKVSRNSKDNTIEIKKQFVKWFQEQSLLYQRIASAFPNFEKKLEKEKIRKWHFRKNK